MSYIKNIAQQSVLPLAGQVLAQPGQIVSKTLAQNDAVSITLFAFDKGEEIGAHDSEGDAMVQVLEGTGRFTVGDREHHVHAGFAPKHARRSSGSKTTALRRFMHSRLPKTKMP